MSSLRSVQDAIPASVRKKEVRSRHAHEDRCSENNDYDEPNQINALRAALIKRKMADDKQETKMMLNSYQIIQASHYKIKIAVGAKSVWTT